MKGDFRVGEWLVHPDLDRIESEEDSRSIQPRVMDVLVYLADHSGEVLSKELIIGTIWPETFVTDEVLTNAISELRRAFGDDAKHPRVIETIPRRGYRLIAEVTFVEVREKKN